MKLAKPNYIKVNGGGGGGGGDRDSALCTVGHTEKLCAFLTPVVCKR